MEFPFGHGHHNRRRDDDDDDDDEKRFPQPTGYDGPPPRRPGYGGDDDEQRFPQPPGYDGPPPRRPGYGGGDDEQRFPPPSGYGGPHSSRPGYGGDDSYSYGPPPVQHTSHEYVPSRPLPVEDFYDEPPPSNYPPSGEFGGYGREEPSHQRPHGGDRPFSNPVGRVGHESLGGGEMARQPTVRIFTKAKEDYALAIRDGKVVLVPADPRDEYQHWIKDLRYSTRVKDQEGFPSFALVNKATGEAIKHSVGASHPVRLVPYQPERLDESVLWTESSDTGEGFRCIRMVNNIDLNFDALHGDEDHGGVREGTPVVLWEWLKGKNQRWRIVPY